MLARTAAALFAGLLASPACADERSESLLRDFIAWVDSSPDWTAAAGLVRSEGSATIAEGLTFANAEAGASVTVERVSLDGLVARADGGFTAAGIEMSGGAVATAGTKTTIPSAEVSDVSMPSFAGVVVAPDKLMTAMARAYTLAADGAFEALSIPEVRIEQEIPGPVGSPPGNSTVTYRDLTAGPFEGGVLERQEVGPIAISGSSPEGEAFQVEIARASVERMDVAALAYIVDEARYREGKGDGVWRPLISRFVYSGFAGGGADGATFAIDELAMENLDGRQTDEPFTEVWDKLLDPNVPQEAKNDLALEAVTGMFGAWRVGTVRMHGLSARAPADEGSFSLDALTLTGASKDGVDSLILKAMSAAGREGFLSLDSFEMAGFVSPSLEGLMKFAALENDADAPVHAETMRAAFAALPRLSHLGLGGLAFGKSQAESVSVGSVTLDFDDWNDIYAEQTRVRIDGVEIPRAILGLGAEAIAVLDTLEFDRFNLAMTLDDHWSPGAGTDDATWSISMQDAGELALAYRLTGVTEAWMLETSAAAGRTGGTGEAFLAMLNGLAFDSATLTVTDWSLLDRGFALAAQKQGLNIDGAAYREQMRAALPFLLSAAIPKNLAKLVSGPLQEFMAGGQRLIAEFRPDSPLGVLDLAAEAGDPVRLADVLNLVLRSEAAPAR